MAENQDRGPIELSTANLVEKSFDSLITNPETSSGVSASDYMSMIASSNIVSDSSNVVSDSSNITGD
ncbi:hypothetical protein OOZ51_03120 [Arthrobacter sp. MI7-26]|uniref:hypothetical protein n=1 Tax=Arthrobacter sp. MI7-26 TaxID=2993653 RepID=UPI002248E800|nr:hypothetical protein [Arthrobacter sp. MI7-26]MCX2746805.1 hypothetical protein [Arthrobacter sp. MI7-26]